MTRSTIFISHANPEDNEFVRWLASKLTLAGYVVWCDLDRLKGGDIFWNEVESCLRNDTIRLVAVVSEASYTKSGVRNEWDLGITLDKDIAGFVVPRADRRIRLQQASNHYSSKARNRFPSRVA